MLNPNYIKNIEKRIENTTSCRELAQLNAEITAFFLKLQADVAGKIAIFASLIINPTDLGSVITWINKCITLITGPYNQALAMQAQLLAAQVSLYTALANKLSVLSCPLSYLNDLTNAMKVPKFGVARTGLSLYGGGA